MMRFDRNVRFFLVVPGTFFFMCVYCGVGHANLNEFFTASHQKKLAVSVEPNTCTTKSHNNELNALIHTNSKTNMFKIFFRTNMVDAWLANVPFRMELWWLIVVVSLSSVFQFLSMLWFDPIEKFSLWLFSAHSQNKNTQKSQTCFKWKLFIVW